MLRRFRRGDFLVEAGCPAEVMYLVRSGQIRVFLLEEDGRETTTALLGPGQPVGLAPLLGRAVHHAFAQALTGVDAWAMPAGPLRERLGADPALLGLVVGSFAQRLGVTLGLLRDVALLPVAERALDIEARLAACLGGRPPALSRTTLAALIQARPETLARTQAPEHQPAEPPTGTRLEPARIESARRTFRPGEVVLQADLPTGRVGLVVAGQLQLTLTGAGGRALAVDRLEGGDLFSIGALLGLPPVGLRLVALSDGAVEVLRTGELLDRLADRPDALRNLVHRFGARLERLERRLARATAADARQRLLELLVELAPRDGQSLPAGARALPGVWSHAALARQMGVCRETVTRALAALASAGAIRREGRHIVVLVRRASVNDSSGVPTAHESPPPPVRHAWATGRGLGQRSDSTDARRALRQAPRKEQSMAAHVNTRLAEADSPSSHPFARDRCRLCGLGVRASSRVCAGCADRLELELQLDVRRACPACGRHRELCTIMPCSPGGDGRQLGSPERTHITWLPVGQIEEPPAGQNSRRLYPEGPLVQLAASIREHGLLQPLCVRPSGSRYQLVFGARRLRAAIRAGMQEVPCIVQVADDQRAFLLNTLENLHRQQLSGAERVRAIERLAATGLGVREISRRTGFNPSTISRWLRIDRCPELKTALETGRLDISRAKILVEAPRAALTELLEQAPSLSVTELRAHVASLKPLPGPSCGQPDNVRRLRQALRCLRAVRRASDPDLLDDIRAEVKRLACTA